LAPVANKWMTMTAFGLMLVLLLAVGVAGRFSRPTREVPEKTKSST
jgi:hypothetical protein